MQSLMLLFQFCMSFSYIYSTEYVKGYKTGLVLFIYIHFSVCLIKLFGQTKGNVFIMSALLFLNQHLSSKFLNFLYRKSHKYFPPICAVLSGAVVKYFLPKCLVLLNQCYYFSMQLPSIFNHWFHLT